MTTLLLIALSIGCTLVAIDKLRHRSGVYTYPFLASAVFLGFVTIQLVGLTNNQNIPEGAIDKTLVMTSLCVFMVYLGGKVGSRPYRMLDWKINRKRLLISSAILSLGGAVFFFLISRLPEEVRLESLPSGIMVAYGFFAQMMTYGFAISALIYASTSSKPALAVLLFDLAMYADRIIVSARRGEMAVVLVILALAFWFRRGWVVPRSIVVGLMIVSVFFIYSTGDYREGAKENGILQTIGNINFKDNISSILNNGGPELELAVYQIEAADRRLAFDFGAFYWNVLVFNYVPAQIVGADIKQSLTVETENSALAEFGYEGMTGSTTTGVVDTFRSFWYFGSLVFFLISYILSRIYAAALSGNFVMQIFYLLLIVKGLHAITHNAGWFLTPWLHMLIFLIPALIYAREGKSVGSGINNK
jgi:hypothetical protein